MRFLRVFTKQIDPDTFKAFASISGYQENDILAECQYTGQDYKIDVISKEELMAYRGELIQELENIDRILG